MCRPPPCVLQAQTKEVPPCAPLVELISSLPVPGTLYQEMLKRQQLLRNFETDVYNRDDTDTCEKTGEALLHVTGKSETCTPLIAGRACMGMTTAMNEIRYAPHVPSCA